MTVQGEAVARESVDLRARREATVREHMSAENAHEFDRCIAAFGHPRYEIMSTGEVWDGSDGVKTFLLENKEAFPDFAFEPQQWHHAQDAVVVEGHFRGTHNGNWRGLPATGRKIDFPLIIVFKFEGEELVCERTYFDIGTPLQQLGVARDPNSLGARIATPLNHPVTLSRAVVRNLRERRR